MNMKKSTDSPTLPSNPEPARPAAPTETDPLVAYCVEKMSKKEDLTKILRGKKIPVPPGCNCPEVYKLARESLSIDDIRAEFRKIWEGTKKSLERIMALHIANLKSGKLDGHGWHGATPSSVHRTFQNLARKYSSKEISWKQYKQIGADYIRHEYFMVATHDICLTQIIQEFDDVIPPTNKTSVSDFVFDGIPYDLKVTTYPNKWVPKAGQTSLKNKENLAKKLYGEADSERERKQAENTQNNWGHNRMYYVVGDQDKWLKDPEGMVRYLLKGLKDKDNFFEIEVGKEQKYRVQVCLVEYKQ